MGQEDVAYTDAYSDAHTYAHIQTATHQGCYSIIQMNKTLPFATVQVDLGDIMLSEISQREKDKHCMISLICGIWKINLWTQQKGNRLRDTENKLVATSGESKERQGKIGMGAKEVYTTATKRDDTKQGIQPTFYNSCKCSVTCKNCESLCCTLVTYITLSFSYTSIKIFFRKILQSYGNWNSVALGIKTDIQTNGIDQKAQK